MKRILIADEFSFCRQLFAFALQHHGYEVKTAEDGLGVIDSLKRERPDLVILEARLPKIDGLSVLRMMRASPDYREVPVFMLTGVENRQQILQAVQIGVQDYILKSKFDLDALLMRIRKCIGCVSGRPAIEEVWEEVGLPLGAGVPGTMEVPGEIAAAPGKQGR
jgi:DNA-binding response OmpR family regulator